MAKFIKPFNMETEIFKLKNRYENNLYRYGLIGEERVSYQLKLCNEDILCMYDVILELGNNRSQYDFIIISRDSIYLLEVKNLLGNIQIYDNGTIERLIYKEGNIERCGMFNPFIQMERQKESMRFFLEENKIKKNIKTLLIMANDKTLIYGNENMPNVIRYDQLNGYLKNQIRGRKLNCMDNELGDKLLGHTKKYNYTIVSTIQKKMMNQYVPKFISKSDENYYIELISLRKELAKRYNIPACNIYNNREAEFLVLNKPKTKNEFISIRGFKEKRYQMFGDDVIKIFQNINKYDIMS